jgi:hypothetical protein
MKVLATVGIVGVVIAAGAAHGAGSASRIVDRTLICTIDAEGLPDPGRYLRVSVSPRRPGGWSPSVTAFNLAGDPGMSVGFTTGSTPGSPTGYLSLSRSKCRTSSVRVPLSSTGLAGGASPFIQTYKCDAAMRVLIRVRATFTRPVTLAPDPRVPSQLVAKGKISTGQLVVATVKGKRISFASADGATGKVKLFIAESVCFD